MKILVCNAGSASVKFGVFDTAGSGASLCAGEFERFVLGQCVLHYQLGGEDSPRQQRPEPLADIDAAIRHIPQLLTDWGMGAPDAIGHRVAHGGTAFVAAVSINTAVLEQIAQWTPLAPLHNPANVLAIEVCQAVWPALPQVAVFDTAFHQTLPDFASTYAVPQAWRDKGVRRYGFHGISHQYIAQRVAQECSPAAGELRLVSCHLGNGASLCAIHNGVSVDTSMGMTPLEGVAMGTRSGDVDPGMFHFLARELGLTPQDIEQQLYHHSGMHALAGSHDLRDIEQKAAEGDSAALLALQVFAYRVRKMIGAYAAAMGGVDVIAFTGGIGENSAMMRQRICQPLGFLGVYVDEKANHAVQLHPFAAPQIQTAAARVKVLVTRTREQWMIAKEVQALLQRTDTAKALMHIPVAVSARHVHLSQAAVEALFGAGYQLQKMHDLRQPGSWAAQETVELVGPKGSLASVRVLGPTRSQTQIEVSQTDAHRLGLKAPLRASGQLDDTPSVLLRGVGGTLQTSGLIVAARHIHMHPDDARAMGLQDGDCVKVTLGSAERALTFTNTLVRVSPKFVTEMHIDTDEANAAGVSYQTRGQLVRNGAHHADIQSV
jgi:acetate kinase